MTDMKISKSTNTGDLHHYKRIKSIIPIYGMSAATIWRKVKDGTFPKPVKLSAGVTAWRNDHLLIWEQDPLNYRAEV